MRTPRRTAPKRTNDPDGMRSRILDATARIFQQQGSGATGMRDVCAAADVTTGALYHHFPTKKDLTLAVIGERVRPEIGSTWVEALTDAPSAPAAVRAVFERVADLLDASGSVSGCPLGNLATELSLSDPDLRAAMAGEYETWRSAIEARMDADRARGLACRADPTGLSYAVVAMFTGAMAVAKAEQSATALRACAAQVDALFR